MHDDEQVGRLFELHKSLQALHIPPRITPDLGFGYGYPLFNFYPPFVYYVAEVFVLLGFSFISSTKIMIAIGFLASGLCMYIFARQYMRKLGALTSAVSYLFLPYHAVDVYVRGALPEFWSFVFIPAIFWLFSLLQRKMSLRIAALCGITIGCLILTHNLVALMSIPFLAAYLLFLLSETKKKWLFFKLVILSGMVGIAISGYFWLPAILEKKYTMVDLLTKELAHYSQHFVYISQLWNSPWGYGGSTFGIHDGMSFQIGKVHVLFALFSFFLWFTKIKRRRLLLLFQIFFLSSVFICTAYSQWLWDLIPVLWYIQFPWRYLLFVGFSTSFLVGYVIDSVKVQFMRGLIAGVTIASLIIFTITYFNPSSYLSEKTDKDYITYEKIAWDTSKLAYEYVPQGIKTEVSERGNTIIAIKKDDIAQGPYRIIQGNASVKVKENKPHYKVFAVVVITPVIFQINTYTFPGWSVFINGKKTTYSDKNDLRLLRIQIAPGAYTIEAKFQDTFARYIGNVLTLVSVCFIAYLFIIDRIKIKKT